MNPRCPIVKAPRINNGRNQEEGDARAEPRGALARRPPADADLRSLRLSGSFALPGERSGDY